MGSVFIQKVELIHVAELISIGKQTFYETFANDNSAEDMQNYLDENFAEEKVKAELSNTHSEFYFAKNNDVIIGYLKLNHAGAQTEEKFSNSIEIERIYVLKEFHGKKIGQFLLDFAINLAKEKQVNYLWLGVWERNEKAIRFYQKNNFVAFDKHIFQLGNDAQTDILMKRML